MVNTGLGRGLSGGVFFIVQSKPAAFSASIAAACTASLMAVSTSSATTPDLGWRGVERVAILTELVSNQADTSLTSRSLCSQIATIAQRGAPVPVSCIQIDEPAIESAKTALLIVHASVTQPETFPQLLFTIRRNRSAGLEPSPIYFGAAPRAAPLDGSATGKAAVEEALRASLSEILPWLRPQQGTLKAIKWGDAK